MRRLIYRPVVHLLLIGILGLLVYSNTFHSPFQWDEAYYLLGNPAVKDLAHFMDPSPQGMDAYAFKNRYIGYLTFALNYRLHGFDVVGYHLVNLSIHLINAVLVYFLVLLTFRTPYFRSEESGVRSQESGSDPPLTPHTSHFIALAVALFFVSHPVQTEAVTYVFQRFASLVAMFYLLSLVLYIKGRIRQAERQVKAKVKVKEETDTSTSVSASTAFLPSSAYTFTCFFLSFISAVLAMKTKENAFTLPVVIVLYEFLFFSGPVKSRIFRLLPFLLTMLVIPITIIQIEGSFGETMKPMSEPVALGYENLPRQEYFLTQVRVITTYIRLLLLPVKQNVIYDYPIYHSLFDPPVLLSFIFLSALFGTAVYLLWKTRRLKPAATFDNDGVAATFRLRSSQAEACGYDSHMSHVTRHALRLIAFGILWFFITLSVESSVIPLAMVINEYRVYLPSVGFFLALAAGGLLLLQRFRERSKQYALTGKQPEEESKQYEVSTKQTEGSKRNSACCLVFAVVVLVLASATYARNDVWTDKISLWEDVVRKNPNSPNVYNNLGIAYYEKGLYRKAIDMYQRAISLSPDHFFAYANMGVAYAVTGRTGMAIEYFMKSIERNPTYSITYANLGHALRQSGRFVEAAENYLKAVALNPYDGAAFYGLGSAYVMLGRLDDALAAHTRFVELSPRDPEAYRSRGIVYAKQGDMSRARSDFQTACDLGSRESCAYLKAGR